MLSRTNEEDALEYLIAAFVVFAILTAIASLIRRGGTSPVKSYSWTSHVTVDPMTDVETTLVARKAEDGDSAMVTPEQAMLSISIEQGKVICAIVSLPQIDSSSLLECRLDDQASQTLDYVRVGSSLIINTGVKFVDVLRAASRLRVRLSSYGHICSFTFDLSGLDDAIRRVTSASP